MGVSKVYVNQGGVDWFFVINEVNLFYNRRNPPHKKRALFWWFEYLIISEWTVYALVKIYITWLYMFTLSWFSLSFEICLPFIDFLCHLKYPVKHHVSKSLKNFVLYTIWYSWRIKVNFFLCYILNLIWMHKKNILKD